MHGGGSPGHEAGSALRRIVSQDGVVSRQEGGEGGARFQPVRAGQRHQAVQHRLAEHILHTKAGVLVRKLSQLTLLS